MPKRDQDGRGGFSNVGFQNKRQNTNGNRSSNGSLDLQKLEKALAKDFHDKPNSVREQLLDEFHGVLSRAVDETPELVEEALEAFQLAVDNSVPEQEKGAYYKACSMKSTYIESTPFRLKFLRAELFDPEKAALRFVRSLDFLLEKFGEYALMRQIYMSDLSKEEMNFFKKGYVQILPFRDTVGRRVIVNLGSYGGLDYTKEAKERVGAYVHWGILSEDVTTQRKGAISVGLMNDDAIEGVRDIDVASIRRFTDAMPVRYTGYHTCIADTFQNRLMKALALTFFLGELRFMSRFHMGTHVERDYELRTFGIPTECIPLSCTGTIKEANHKTSIKMRTKLDDYRKAEANGDYIRYYSPDSTCKSFHAIECPEIDAFLVRRNGVAWNYPGNISVRALLEEKLGDQQRLKENFVSAITEELIALDIPILVYEDQNGWYVRVTNKQDIQKQVLYIMREIRKRRRMREKTATSLKANTGVMNAQFKNRTMKDSCFNGWG